VFADGAEGKGEIIHAYENMTRNEIFRSHTRLTSLTFADMRRFMPLQAADILAYELNRRVSTQLELDARPRRPYPLSVLSQRPNKWIYFKEGAFKDWDKGLSVDPTGGTLEIHADGTLQFRRRDGSLYVAGEDF
jgi:hypothetical protein